MELKEFISTTLVSVKEGVGSANKKAGNVFRVRSGQDKVDFDIAVVIAKEKGSEKGAGLAIKVVEGKISGSSRLKESSHSRIKFSVGISTHIK